MHDVKFMKSSFQRTLFHANPTRMRLTGVSEVLEKHAVLSFEGLAQHLHSYFSTRLVLRHTHPSLLLVGQAVW